MGVAIFLIKKSDSACFVVVICGNRQNFFIACCQVIMAPSYNGKPVASFYQRVSIASYESAGIATGGMSVCPSVCPSVRHTPVLYQNEES